GSKVKTLIESRGAGGLIILAGGPLGVHPSKEPYKIQQGSYDAIPRITPDEREELFSIARAFNKYVKPDQIYSGPPETGNPAIDRPGDAFNQRGEILDVLLGHGWKIVGRRAHIIDLAKPGKRGRGSSATLHAVAPNVLYVFSTSAHPF